MKKLYIHAGLPKTGTTSIQTCCTNNREILYDFGINYPVSSVFQHNHFAMTKTAEVYDPCVDAQKNFEGFISQVAHDSHSVLLSSESFLFDEPEKYDILFQMFDAVYIVVYIRNVYDISNAGFVQNIKTPEAVNNLFSRSIFFSSEYVQPWFQRFGRQNFIIKNFDMISNQGDLLKDFFSTIGVVDISNFTFSEHENVTLKTCYAFFLRHLANIPLAHDTWYECVSVLTSLSQADIQSPVYRSIPDWVWDRNLSKINEQIQLESDWLQDSSWPVHCNFQRYRLPFCPYTQLSADEQHRIFGALPEHLRDAIMQAWPTALEAQTDEPLFPPLFESEAVDNTLFRWRRAFFEGQINIKHSLVDSGVQLASLAARTLSLNFAECIYHLNAEYGILPLQDIQNMLWDGTALNFTSVGNDPICLLPDISIPDGKICIIQVSATGPCLYWQLFYCTDLYGFHSEVRSLNFDPTSTLNNMCGAVIVLPSDALGNNIRLDPGTKCGQCSIKKLNVFIV